jgi:type I restriction enzyme R subunit
VVQGVDCVFGEEDADGLEYTEDGINGFASKEIPAEFKKDAIAFWGGKKYQTDSTSRCCAPYVDKRFDGVQAVQTLSRLNRSKHARRPRT